MANDASMSLALACDVDALAAAQRRLAEFLEGAGCSERTRFRVELVIEELAMNVIMHVAPETSARGMTLWAEVDEGHVRLALEDAGPEFDPLKAVPPRLRNLLDDEPFGGWGLRLIQKMTDDVRYRRTETGLNRLEMEIRAQ